MVSEWQFVLNFELMHKRLLDIYLKLSNDRLKSN